MFLRTLENCFNSKMVRLKEYADKRKDYETQSFNSKMVRLKEAQFSEETERQILFQFQNGAIKRF